MQLLPGDFLQNNVSSQFNLFVGGMNVATVRHRRVHIQGTTNPKKYGHIFDGNGWNTVVGLQHLEPGKPIVFTNLGGNSVSLSSFARNGLGVGFEPIPRMPLNEHDPICRGSLDKGTWIKFLETL